MKAIISPAVLQSTYKKMPMLVWSLMCCYLVGGSTTPDAVEWGAKEGVALLLKEPGATAKFAALRDSMVKDVKLRRMLSDSIVSSGSGEAYYTFVKKLHSGSAVTIVVFGGSVTCGNGLADKRHWRYSALLERWLNKNLRAAGGDNHTVANLCSSAMGTEILMQTVKQQLVKLPTPPDLVLLEFALNDAQSDNGGATVGGAAAMAAHGRSMEAVVRVLLGDTRTAVMMLEIDCARFMYNTAEDVHREVATFYGVPMLSMRQALHTGVSIGVEFGCASATANCPVPRSHHNNNGRVGQASPAFCGSCESDGIRLCTAQSGGEWGREVWQKELFGGSGGGAVGKWQQHTKDSFFGLMGVDDMHSNCIGHAFWATQLQWMFVKELLAFERDEPPLRDISAAQLPCCATAFSSKDTHDLLSATKWEW
jgi:lysophospholipase L1-like esterase